MNGQVIDVMESPGHDGYTLTYQIYHPVSTGFAYYCLTDFNERFVSTQKCMNDQYRCHGRNLQSANHTVVVHVNCEFQYDEKYKIYVVMDIDGFGMGAKFINNGYTFSVGRNKHFSFFFLQLSLYVFFGNNFNLWYIHFFGVVKTRYLF